MSAMAGEGRTLVLPSRYPVATRVRKDAKSFGNPRGSTRFGTEGSEIQILLPRPIFPCQCLLRHSESVPVRIRVDLDDDLRDSHAWRLAAANRFHRDETGGLEFRQGPSQVR